SPSRRSSTPPRAVLRRLLSALAAVALLSASAAACSSDGTVTGSSPSPSVDPYDVAASVQASESATAPVSLSAEDAALRATALAMEAPEKPAKMSENSPEGAVAAAEYFVSLYPYVYATGDLTEWDATCEPTSKLCSSVSNYVRELHAEGGWGDPWTQTIKTARSTETDDAGTLIIELTLDSDKMVRHRGDGTTESDSAAKDQVFRGRFLWSGSAWILQVGEFK
ncbi:DUF6318 family protein, partial [Actinomyces radicidentis]|uniref:DUF6318 family protein n=1 Tax=Actinomyces radicidentis TaxID=111015 RepID=UPI0028EFFD4B